MLSGVCQRHQYNGAWGTYRVGWLVWNTQQNRGVERLLPLKLLEGQVSEICNVAQTWWLTVLQFP